MSHDEAPTWDVRHFPLEPLFAYLEGPQGCHFRPKRGGTFEWTCSGTLRKTRRWLERHGYPTRTVLDYCRNHGGMCDCEVVFNTTQCYFDAQPFEAREEET